MRSIEMIRHALALAALAVAVAAGASCGAAFCTLETGWDAQGAWGEPGTRLSARYELVRQDQPRRGSDKVSVGALPRHHDEVSTRSRNLILGLEHAFAGGWGLSASLPVVDRRHEHIHNHHGARLRQTWDFTRIGDLRLLGRYQHDVSRRGEVALDLVGLDFGLKLPSGERDVRNARGELAERSLQPGSGTTDVLLGMHFARRLPIEALSGFAKVLVQSPLGRRAGYEPGTQVKIDVGVRKEVAPSVGLMLQLNYLYKDRDSGPESEPDDTGGRFLYASPGASWNPTPDLQLYAFLQLPVYQRVNGIQLTADHALVVGASTRF